jgi:hypothetical protein
MQPSQRRAVVNHRRRLAERGIARYEVRGLAQDKPLLRRLAQRLAADDAEAARLRMAVASEIGEAVPSGRSIWASLRHSPLVGFDWALERDVVAPRDVDL